MNVSRETPNTKFHVKHIESYQVSAGAPDPIVTVAVPDIESSATEVAFTVMDVAVSALPTRSTPSCVISLAVTVVEISHITSEDPKPEVVTLAWKATLPPAETVAVAGDRTIEVTLGVSVVKATQL